MVIDGFWTKGEYDGEIKKSVPGEKDVYEKWEAGELKGSSSKKNYEAEMKKQKLM